MENNKLEEYKTVYIVRYLNGERNFRNERTVFDNFQIEELMGEERAQEICQELNKKANLEAENNDITSISIKPSEAEEKLIGLKGELIGQASTVGGDDDSFDYFPDLVFAFEQICKAFNRIDIYNSVLPILNDLDALDGHDKWEAI